VGGLAAASATASYLLHFLAELPIRGPESGGVSCCESGLASTRGAAALRHPQRAGRRKGRLDRRGDFRNSPDPKRTRAVRFRARHVTFHCLLPSVLAVMARKPELVRRWLVRTRRSEQRRVCDLSALLINIPVRLLAVRRHDEPLARRGNPRLG